MHRNSKPLPNMLPNNTLDRLLEKTYLTPGCWVWHGTRMKTGYGTMSVCGRSRLIHRVAYHLFYEPPAEGLYVCHHCDNPSCWNPAHLFIGTPVDNQRDMIAKGRQNREPYGKRKITAARGEEAGPSKLTAEQVREIFTRYYAGEESLALAKEFGVSQGNISMIVARRTWRETTEGMKVAPRTGQGIDKITAAQAVEIFIRRRAGERGDYLAKEFGISPTHVSLIFRRKSWKQATAQL